MARIRCTRQYAAAHRRVVAANMVLAAVAQVHRPMTAPLAIARQYQDITEVFRARRIELGLSYAYLDAACGFADGHAEAILGPSAKKGWGQSTMFMLCDVLAVEFHAFVNMEAVKRMEISWEQRQMGQVSENSRISVKLIDKAKPHIFREMQRLSTAAKMTCLTAEHRSRIARKAAKSRWRKVRKLADTRAATA